MYQAIEYIRKNIGLNPELQQFSKTDLNKLPLYLRKGQELVFVVLGGNKFIFTFNKSIIDTSPDQLKKQAEFFHRTFNMPVVFVFNELESYQRKRLIERQIAFIIPFKQMYIPFLLIDLREFKSKAVEKKEKLSPVSQCLILYHLEKQSLENISFGHIAQIINYSNMSITRAVGELADLKICSVLGKKEKWLKFYNQKKELWLSALPNLKSPIKEKIYANDIIAMGTILKSNDSALEYYTKLSSGNQIAYAISAANYLIQKKMGKILVHNTIGGDYNIEVWNYDPSRLSETNVVDPLSLYLSMMHDEDERVKIALNELLGKVKW